MGLVSITGSWDDIALMCTYRHEKPVRMQIKEGPLSLFYACPKYQAENRSEGEPACNNRLNLNDFEKMLAHLNDMRRDAELRNEKLSLKNYRWKDRKGTEFTVLSHEKDKITVGVANWQAIRK